MNGTFELATNATVRSPTTLLIHLRLATLPHLAHFNIVAELLGEYFHEDENRFRTLDLPFSIEDDADAAEWTSKVVERLRMVRKHEHVVVFVTTHSDPERGDLWTKASEHPEEEPCAVSVSEVSTYNTNIDHKLNNSTTQQFLTTILGPFSAKLDGSMLFLFACGSVVKKEPAFDELKKGLRKYVSYFLFRIYRIANNAFNRLGVANAIAFDAERLSTVNTVDLLPKVIKSTIIHGFPFDKALEDGLRQCPSLGKHTNVVHFTPHSVIKYLWAHKKYQPYGRQIPIQCPQCGILDPWSPAHLNFPDGRSGYQLECKNAGCGMYNGRKINDRHSITVAQPPKSTLFSSMKDSRGAVAGWLQVPVD